MFAPPSEEPFAKVAEDREMEARIGQFEAKGVFPIQVPAHRIRSLPVGEARNELKHANQGEPPGGQCGWTEGREQIGKQRIVIESAEMIP